MSEVTYTMTISRTTVDKLGIKMYDKASAVVAELVANGYDADAENVTIRIPLNRWLATKRAGRIVDRGLTITVEDDGHGMTPDVINDFYLKVGADPRIDPRRGPRSLEKGRQRMGRKGIGKLAPFGICRIIEVITSGGDRKPEGFEVAHFILDLNEIISETDEPYNPQKGELDGTFRNFTGTTIQLKRFSRRRTPDRDTFDRQVSRRFGLQLLDFNIRVIDTAAREGEESEWVIGTLDVDIKDETLINLENLGRDPESGEEADRLPQIKLDDDTILPVIGWIAYSNQSYRNEEVAGIRIYSRGKIVSTTRDFGIKSGFTGEFKMRSYLIGEIHADWIDEDEGEDIIRSDRQDILWDSEKGSAFREWGKKILRIIAKMSRGPMRETAKNVFFAKSNLDEKARIRFADEKVIEAALEVGKTIGSIASLDELADQDYVDELTELVLTIAPHKMLVDKLKEIGEEDVDYPIELIVKLFNDAKIAEMASLGQVAFERIKAIEKLQRYIQPGAETEESDLQKLLEQTPWLIDPQWTVLQANRTFYTVRQLFETWFAKEYGEEIVTSAIEPGRRRPDFIMLHIGSNIEIVEIKDIDHILDDGEFGRVSLYYQAMMKFLEDNDDIKRRFPFLHVTLICDHVNLTEATAQIAYDSMIEDKLLKRRTWIEVLTDASQAHTDFLEVARVR